MRDLITPSRFAPCPACGRVRPRRSVRQRWRRPYLPAMNLNGAGLLNPANGKVYLNPTTGRPQLVPAGGAGDCLCCGPGICTECQTNNATVSFVDVARCWECTNNGRVQLAPASFSQSFSLAYTGVCSYTHSTTSGPITVTYRQAVVALTCTGAICATEDNFIVTLTFDSGTGLWGVFANIAGISGAGVFAATFASPTADDYCFTITVDNENDCPASATASCGAEADSALNYYHGGTATITVGTGG